MKRAMLLCVLLTLLPHACFANRTLIDELGRTIAVPDHPHRIICLIPSVTDTVYELGAGDDVVAVSDYTKYPAAARSKPSVGSLSAPSLETILSLHPDLVLGTKSLNQKETIAQIEAAGIPVFLVDPHGIDGIYRSVLSVGRALNREATSVAVVASLRQRVAAVQTRTQGRPAPSVFMPLWYDPIVTIGKHAFITEIIEAAGGQSITADIAQEWPQVSMESVVARAPQALLLVRGSKTTLDLLRTRPGWSSLPAVHSGRVYYVDDRIDFPSPVAIDALEDLARQFHP